jgi:hypothetical protein
MSKKFFLTATLVFRDEKIYLKEWLDYHILNGVQHFYLYDNRSKDNPKEILDWYFEQGLITYIFLDKDLNRQSLVAPHRNENIERGMGVAEWMLFTDIDEFVCLKDLDSNLHSEIRKLDDFSAIAIRSINYGSNYNKYYKDDLVISRFTRREKLPTSYKSLVRPESVAGAKNGHAFHITDHKTYGHTVSVNKKMINLNDISWVKKGRHIKNDAFYINHYISKSQEEFYSLKFKNNIGMEKIKGKFLRLNGPHSCNEIIARKILFFEDYLRNDFVQLHYDKIKNYYMYDNDIGISKFLKNVK